MNELTTLEVLPPRETTGKATLDLRSGAIYFFTRDKPREFLLQTRSLDQNVECLDTTAPYLPQESRSAGMLL